MNPTNSEFHKMLAASMLESGIKRFEDVKREICTPDLTSDDDSCCSKQQLSKPIAPKLSKLKYLYLTTWLSKFMQFLEKKGYFSRRTKFCKHETHCWVENALNGFATNFYYGFLAKALIAVALGMLKPSKTLLPNILSLLAKDTLSFWTFMGSVCGGFKLALCLLRRLRGKDDGINALIAGFISGFSLFFESSNRRKKFMVISLLWRGLDALVSLLDIMKIVKKIPHFEVYFFGPMIGFLMYIQFFENSCFPPGIDKPFKALAGISKAELAMGEEIWKRQGAIWYPPLPTKLKVR